MARRSNNKSDWMLPLGIVLFIIILFGISLLGNDSENSAQQNFAPGKSNVISGFLSPGYAKYYSFANVNEVRIKFTSVLPLSTLFVLSKNDYDNFLKNDSTLDFQSYPECTYGGITNQEIDCSIHGGGVIIWNYNQESTTYTIENLSGYSIFSEEDIPSSYVKELPPSNIPVTQDSPSLNNIQLNNSDTKTLDLAEPPRHQPKTYGEAQLFVRPEETAVELTAMRLSSQKTTEENMDLIFSRFYLNYASDETQFGVSEYWQTPAESTANKGGDCEDWAIHFVSLLREHNSSLNCYAAAWDTHMSVICRIDRKFFIYDQGRTSGKHIIEENLGNDQYMTTENTVEMRAWLNRYFRQYGLSPDKRTLSGLFNEKEILTFNSLEDFISWAVSFQSTKDNQ